MKKLLMLGVALTTISAATLPAMAQMSNDAGAAVGATAGGATGGTIGFLLGGPIGAIVGGWAGAVIGADAAVSDEAVLYAGENPVEPIYLDAQLDVGFAVPADVTLHPIEGEDRYGYFYANNRVWIVDMETRQIVQSPGFAIRNDTVAWVQANPSTSITFDGDLEVGATLDAGIDLQSVPDDSGFSYVYLNDRPVLVDTSSRAVIWIG